MTDIRKTKKAARAIERKIRLLEAEILCLKSKLDGAFRIGNDPMPPKERIKKVQNMLELAEYIFSNIQPALTRLDEAVSEAEKKLEKFSKLNNIED